jgi:hypothetical protein
MLAVLLVAVWFTACWPTERVLWAPDGKRALVITERGLHLCDADGKLSPMLEPKVLRACWMPDSRHILAVRKVELKTWDDFVGLIPETTRIAVTNQTEGLLADLRANTNVPFRYSLREHQSYDHPDMLYLCLRQNGGEPIVARVGRTNPGTSDAVSAWQVQRHDLSPGSTNEPKVLLRSDKEILTLSTSPAGKAFVCSTAKWSARAGPSGAIRNTELWVCPADGRTPPQVVAENTSVQFDWSPDGLSLVYVRATETDNTSRGRYRPRLGELNRQVVCASDGVPVPRLKAPTKDVGVLAWDTAKESTGTTTIAMVLFRYDMRIRCLPNGAVLFDASETALPGLPQDRSLAPSLFSADPATPGVVKRVLSRDVEAQMGDLRGFTVSPDGKALATFSTNGIITAVTLASGEVQRAQPYADRAKVGRYPQTLPVWRSTGELCFAAPLGPKGDCTNRADIVLWSPSVREMRCISGTWSNETLEGWLVPRKQNPQ